MAIDAPKPKTPQDYLREWAAHISAPALKGDTLSLEIECEVAAQALMPDIVSGKLLVSKAALDLSKAAELNGLADAAGFVYQLFNLEPPKRRKTRREKVVVPAAGDGELERDEIGRIIRSERNMLTAFARCRITLRYNEFADSYLIDGLEGYGPTLNDHALDELYLLIQRDFHFKPAKEDFDRVVFAHARRNRFHPVKSYLSGLEWDGVERIDEWLVAYGGAMDDAVVRAVGRIVLVAAVRRIIQPGCKFDELLILEGLQGTLKSSAIAALSPDPAWVTDSLSLSAEEKIVAEQTLGIWLAEIGELSGYRKREVEHIKQFLSRQVERARLAYGRLRTDRPRQFIPIGTTNETHYLVDDTGDRRFWPVRIERFDIESLVRDRDQLWAEAVYWEAKGESIRLAQELWPLAAEHQAARKETDEWTSVVSGWLDAEERDPRPQFIHFSGIRVTLADIAKEALGIKLDKLDKPTQMRLARCLNAAGWFMADRSHGQRYWRRKEGATSA